MKLFEGPINLLHFGENSLLLLNGKIIQEVDLTPLLTSNKPPIFTNFTLPSTGLPRNYLCLSKIDEKNFLIGT